MTIEEAKQKIYNASKEDRSSPKNCIHLLYLHGFIDQIFDYFGEQLQDKDDEIELLKHRVEEVMKPKTCLDCKHYSQSTFYGDLKVVKYCHENRLGIGDINFQIFCCNKFEPKDNA